MGINLIALSIPAFFLLIGVEAFVGWAKKRPVYRFADAIADLGCGIGSEATGVFMKGAIFAIYVWVYEQLRIFDLDDAAALTWIVATLGFDFGYYWWHRLSHRINLLWAAHVVHHQSEDYNLAVALRQAYFTRLSSWITQIPLALIGVPPVVYAVTSSLNTLYQFWIHTRLVGNLGPLEWFLNTPSHHRVHHGINPKYIDKNYAGLLIVWDRFFGTFTQEEEEPVYGTVKRLRSWDPVWAQLDTWAHIWRSAVAAPRWRDKVKAWVGVGR